MWYSLDDMVRQFQWAGNRLVDTGLLVGPDEVDVPQQQFRSPILRPDPIPRVNPRPSPNVTPIPYIGQPLPTTPGNLGFTQYTLGASAASWPPQLYPTTMAKVLAQVLANAGVTAPPDLVATAVFLSPAAASVPLLAANPSRTFLLVYNPTQVIPQISLGAAALGGLNNLSIGPGEAYFWSTSQGLGPAYTGALTAVTPFPTLPLWVWEDGGGAGEFYNDGGVLGVTAPANYPPNAGGLPGSIWSNGGVVSVVPDGFAIGISSIGGPDGIGWTYIPSSPVFFGSITPPQLLLLGGYGLPLSDPQVLNQLWNSGGEVWISAGGIAPAFYNDGGVLGVTSGAGYPPTASGAAGSIWSNGGVVSVVPGGTPFAGSPVFFGSISPASLLALGGLGLPLTDPETLNQLWNNGGEVLISNGGIALYNDGGVLAVGAGAGYPTTAGGAAGSIWSNGGVVSVVPGGTPFVGSPIFFGSITAAALLALGGLGLPTTQPTLGSLQIWNNGGEVWVA
jgi:hypothetical protein